MTTTPTLVDHAHLDLIHTAIATQHQLARSTLFEPLEKLGLTRYHGIKASDFTHECTPTFDQHQLGGYSTWSLAHTQIWTEASRKKLEAAREVWSKLGEELDVFTNYHVYFNRAVCKCARKETVITFSLRAYINWNEIKFMREYLLQHTK